MSRVYSKGPETGTGRPWPLAGPAVMSLRMSSFLGLQRILGTSDLDLALLASPGRREVLRVGSLGQADWWQWAVFALSWKLGPASGSQQPEVMEQSPFSCWDIPSETD